MVKYKKVLKVINESKWKRCILYTHYRFLNVSLKNGMQIFMLKSN